MIFYRVSPFKQHNIPPVYADDKWNLVKLAHKTFLDFNDHEPTTYLLDRCEGWNDYFQKYGRTVNYTGTDRSYSIGFMFNLAKDIKGKVLMVEDDYLWVKNKVDDLLVGLDYFKLVSPYDHPAHYIEDKFKDFDFKLKLIGKQVWRNSPSNTHTFGTTGEYIREHWDIFKDGYWDAPMFEKLPDQVWNPIPSFATHLCSDWMAPNVDWTPYLKTSTD